MVSYDCQFCDGSGKEEVVEVRGGKVNKFIDNCSNCMGAGTFRNGKPELDIDLGVTDDFWEGDSKRGLFNFSFFRD